jgi:hypothetical protein
MAGIESFYGKEDLADMDVVIVEVGSEDSMHSRRKRSRGEELVLPGHRLAVCGASEVLNAQVRAFLYGYQTHMLTHPVLWLAHCC